jgi:murein DD-endopeptidase MepM/ murein hydrolase activator NlpD
MGGLHRSLRRHRPVAQASVWGRRATDTGEHYQRHHGGPFAFRGDLRLAGRAAGSTNVGRGLQRTLPDADRSTMWRGARISTVGVPMRVPGNRSLPPLTPLHRTLLPLLALVLLALALLALVLLVPRTAASAAPDRPHNPARPLGAHPADPARSHGQHLPEIAEFDDEGAATARTDSRAYTKPGWLPFRGSTNIGCVLTNCNGSGHADWAIDLPFARHTPIYATGSGRVLATVTDQGGNCDQAHHALHECPDGRKGNSVLVDHGGGTYSFYGHLGAVLVTPGATVTDGTVLGGASDSGWSPPGFVHLHYEEWDGLLWSGGVRTVPRDLKGCHDGTTVTYPSIAGYGSWNAMPGFHVALRHDGGCNANGPTCISGFLDVLGTHPFCAEITWMVHAGITDGFSDGRFRTTTATTRQAAIAWLHRLAGEPDGPFPDPGFPDVPPSHPFHTAIAWGTASGLVDGFEDGEFKPTRPVSRQALMAWLHRSAGAPPGPFPAPDLSDVTPDRPFYDEISWAVHEGIAQGFDDGTFKGWRDMTRQAGAAFLWRAFGGE